MGLNMCLYLRKENYRASTDATIEYPKELKEFQDNNENRCLSSIKEIVEYKIGFWNDFSQLHNEICKVGFLDGILNKRVFGKKGAEKILKWLEMNENNTKAEYSIKVFKNAIAFLKKHKSIGWGNDNWSLVYHAFY